MARPITFLSDYGYDDEFAGVCRAVIARIAPEARVIDLTHGIDRHAVADGALVLANALPYAPAGVHLAPSRARIEPGPRVVARVARVDRFGNLILDLLEQDLPASGLRLGRPLLVEARGTERDAIYARTFAEVADGELLAYLNSSGALGLAVNRGSAADLIGVGRGDEVALRPA